MLGEISKRSTARPWASDVTFNTDWAANPGYQVQYRIFEGMVQLSGRVTKSGTAPGCGVRAFTLPAGYRPAQARTLMVGTPLSSGGVMLIEIDTLGRVFISEMGVALTVAMTASTFYLDGIQFKI